MARLNSVTVDVKLDACRDVLQMPARPMWPDIDDVENSHEPHTDIHRLRRFDDAAYLPIGVTFGHYSPNHGPSNRMSRFIDPAAVTQEGPDGPRLDPDNTSPAFLNWNEFFNSRFFADILDWLKPNILRGGTRPSGKLPLVHHIRPHGGLMGREPYSYYAALEAAELGSPYLVEGYYEHIRGLRNSGIDTITHLGNPSRNSDRQWYGDEATAVVRKMLDYGKTIACLDNCVAFPEDSETWNVAKERWATGCGVAIEGAPVPGLDWWAKTPYTILNWAGGAHGRFITGSIASGKYPIAGTPEFFDKYGDRLWVFPLQTKHISTRAPSVKKPMADIVDYLTKVRELSTDLFRGFNTTGKCVVSLDSNIIKLAAFAGWTPSEFVS